MNHQTKIYIEDDISTLYHVFRELGFSISGICANQAFYDTLLHPTADIVIKIEYDLKKKRKRWLWVGSWDNFEISIKRNSFDSSKSSPHLYRADFDLYHTLIKEMVYYIGGRIEVKTRMADSAPYKKDIYKSPTHPNQNDQRIRDILQYLVDTTALKKPQKIGSDHMSNLIYSRNIRIRCHACQNESDTVITFGERSSYPDDFHVQCPVCGAQEQGTLPTQGFDIIGQNKNDLSEKER